ncbi:MAG: hypothetical protein P4L53_08865 [Candidatus Obscuribacterales bacterium]|nr:hypothetical protein [Candidatus Obscuribacterales bacterium]
MTLTPSQIRLRIAGGFRTAQISREERKAVETRAKKTMEAREALAEFQHEYVERLENGVPDSAAYLAEKIGLLMQLGEQARVLRSDYERFTTKHETLRQGYHAELQKKRLPHVFRQDIADAYEQHSSLLEDLDGAKAAEAQTYQQVQIMLEKLEPRLMAFYPAYGFPVFHELDAHMREQALEEAYEEGGVDFDEALLGENQEEDSWKPTRH